MQLKNKGIQISCQRKLHAHSRKSRKTLIKENKSLQYFGNSYYGQRLHETSRNANLQKQIS